MCPAQRPQNLFGTYVTMGVTPVIAVLIAVDLVLHNPGALWLSAPVLVLWALSPALAFWMSRPGHSFQPHLGAQELLFLRAVARRTWRFFETYVARDNYLPPDNFQEEPPRVAHRTSPTNIGMALLANLAAYDFGYIDGGGLVERDDADPGHPG